MNIKIKKITEQNIEIITPIFYRSKDGIFFSMLGDKSLIMVYGISVIAYTPNSSLAFNSEIEKRMNDDIITKEEFMQQ